MKVTICVLIALFCIGNSFQMAKHLKGSLKTTHFGNLFAQIKSQIAAGGPLANIEGLLDELEEQIHDEQHRHQAMLDRNRAACVAEDEFRTGEIAEGNSALRRATNHLAACQSSLEKTLVDITNTKKDIADTEASLATAVAQRAAGHAHYNEVVGHHKHALGVINGAFAILDDFVTEDASLIQLSKHTAKMAKAAFAIQQATSMAPVLAMFAQMATSENDMFLDVASINRIKELIQDCADKVQHSLEEANGEEAVAVENHRVLKNNLESSLRELNDQLVRLQDHAEEMAQCVLEEKVLIQSSNEKITRNTNLLQMSREMCAAFEAEFAAATAGRNEELELLVVVRKMVKKRLGGLGASVTSRDDSFDNEAVQTYEGADFAHDGGDRDDALEGYGI